MKKRRVILFLAVSALLCSCGEGNGDAIKDSVETPSLFPMGYKGIDFDVVEAAKASYFAQFVLPQKMKKSDGSAVSFLDVVAPYRYGGYGAHEVLFLTIADEAFASGRMGVDPFIPAVIHHNDIDIEFVGHLGYPYVLTKCESDPYRPDTSEYEGPSRQRGLGGSASGVYMELLTFEEALKLEYFSDDDLRGLAIKADEIRDNPESWHWNAD